MSPIFPVFHIFHTTESVRLPANSRGFNTSSEDIKKLNSGVFNLGQFLGHGSRRKKILAEPYPTKRRAKTSHARSCSNNHSVTCITYRLTPFVVLVQAIFAHCYLFFGASWNYDRSLHWSFDCFLCRFCSTGVYSK